jgi:uncharacterized protein YcbX
MAIIVSDLYIHPVKSLAAIACDEALLTARGFAHDRRFMVVEPSGAFLTQREHPRMATVWTQIAGGQLRLAAPDRAEVAVPLEPVQGEAITVEVWGSTCEALAPSPEADRWLTDYLGLPCRLAYMPESTRRRVNPRYAGEGHVVSFADGYPLLVIGEASLQDLNSRLTHPVPMSRFRPNIVVKGAGAFAEDGWRDIRIGEARLRIAKPCGRCQVTTTDQATGEVLGPEPLATLAAYRSREEFGACFGMNALVLEPGLVRRAAAVLVE